MVFLLLLTICLSLISCVSNSNKENLPENNDSDNSDNADNNWIDDNVENNNNNNNSNNSNDSNNTNDNQDNNSNNDLGDISVEDIVFSSVYSDGVAIVNLINEEKKAYVINKQGNILFDFPLMENQSAGAVNHMKFQNGLLIYNNKCYDTKGNITSPESVGATSFYAFEKGKYIIAERITSTYDSAKKELGVLNTDFEWIVPLKEGFYELYHNNTSSSHDFFWNEVVYSTSNEKKAYLDSYYRNIYFSDGTIMSPADVGATDLDLYGGKYIFADTGIIYDFNGNILLDLFDIDILHYADVNSLKIRNDFLVIAYNYYVDTENYVENKAILLYNLLTNEQTLIEGNDVLSSYCESPMTALEKIIYTSNGKELVYGNMNNEKIEDVCNNGFVEFYLTENNKYIVIQTTQRTLKDFPDGDLYADTTVSMRTYSICDINMNWIIKSIPADEIEIKGDYLKVYSTWHYIENGYYDLRTGEFSVNEPSDYGKTDNDPSNDSDTTGKFDFSSITNIHAHTNFVNGKAAVALWNAEVQEMFLTVVDENGKFLFDPVKTPIKQRFDFLNIPLYFDGEYIVLGNNSNCGSGYTSSLTIYTYNTNGDKIAEWKASDDLDAFSCSFKYNDGVLVFWLSTGNFSDYYRQSRIRYYTHDFEPLLR